MNAPALPPILPANSLVAIRAHHPRTDDFTISIRSRLLGRTTGGYVQHLVPSSKLFLGSIIWGRPE